jgi:hypothetical protein
MKIHAEEVLTNHLKMHEDEAKVLRAKKRADNATDSLFAYPLSPEDKLPRIDRR